MNIRLISLCFAASLFQLAAMTKADEPTQEAHISQSGAAAQISTNNLTPGDVLRRLLDGNERFATSRTRHPNQTAERRRAVMESQNPVAVVLACADSRVSPELIFDQGLGDLFVIRNAGNVLDDHVLGSIEYAVEHLRVSLVIVLAHSGCGAAKATLKGGAVPGHVESIVASLKPSLDATRAEPGNKLDNLIRSHAESTAINIEKSEPILGHAVAEGHLRVVAARYDLETGKVEIVKPILSHVNAAK